MSRASPKGHSQTAHAALRRAALGRPIPDSPTEPQPPDASASLSTPVGVSRRGHRSRAECGLVVVLGIRRHGHPDTSEGRIWVERAEWRVAFDPLPADRLGAVTQERISRLLRRLSAAASSKRRKSMKCPTFRSSSTSRPSVRTASSTARTISGMERTPSMYRSRATSSAAATERVCATESNCSTEARSMVC